jgi:hypothetical protein
MDQRTKVAVAGAEQVTRDQVVQAQLAALAWLFSNTQTALPSPTLAAV